MGHARGRGFLRSSSSRSARVVFEQASLTLCIQGATCSTRNRASNKFRVGWSVVFGLNAIAEGFWAAAKGNCLVRLAAAALRCTAHAQCSLVAWAFPPPPQLSDRNCWWGVQSTTRARQALSMREAAAVDRSIDWSFGGSGGQWQWQEQEHPHAGEQVEYDTVDTVQYTDVSNI